MNKNTTSKLSNELHIKCQHCGKKSNLIDWDNLTYSKCTNREMKRAYKHLNDRKSFNRKADTFYMCPECKRWSRGSQLSIEDTDDLSLKSLGRESIIEIKRG